jgi:hypothetical protein
MRKAGRFYIATGTLGLLCCDIDTEALAKECPSAK